MSARSSPTINRIRTQTPFVDFRSPSKFGSSLSPPKIALVGQNENVRSDSGLRGWGSRHIDDNAPFNLWDEEQYDFRKATRGEQEWIWGAFPGVVAISFTGPTIVIQTSSPPQPVPLTVGGVAAIFVPPDIEPAGTPMTTAYASPRVPDPVPSLKLRRLTRPAPEDIVLIANALVSVADVKALNFYDYSLIVELRHDGRTYARHSLPGTVAGMLTFYHHSQQSYWKDCTTQARQRRINPNQGSVAQDTTDYLAEGGYITPGVRLSSAPSIDSGGYATRISSTTAGVLLRNSQGHVRMTAANHGFLASNEVYHPSERGVRIGEVDEPWAAHDIALVKLDPSINFKNNEYFEANPPKRLLRSSQLPTGTWVAADGISTGIVFLQLKGERIMVPKRATGVQLQFTELLEEHIFYAHGPSGGIAQDGLCGAPMVTEDPDLAGVVGFFHMSNGEQCFAAVLDDLIDRGWDIA